MGEAWIQRHKPNILEDEAGEGRIFERYERACVRWIAYRIDLGGKRDFLDCLNSIGEWRWAEAVYTTALLHEWY